MTAEKMYESIKYPPLKRHIDEVGKILYGTNNYIFAIPENNHRPAIIPMIVNEGVNYNG
jgi:hypothetical protein